MSAATIRIPTPLRAFTGGADEVTCEGATVGALLHQLCEQYDGLSDRIMNDEGGLRPFVNVFLGSEDIRYLDGMDTAVEDGAVLSIIPAVAGGMG